MQWNIQLLGFNWAMPNYYTGIAFIEYEISASLQRSNLKLGRCFSGSI